MVKFVVSKSGREVKTKIINYLFDMNKLVMVGSIVVFFALTFYSISIFTGQKYKKVLPRVLLFLTLGIIFDITATAFMIAGSSKGLFTYTRVKHISG